MPLVFEDQLSVFQFECDPFDRMTPGAALRRIQEAGTQHCETLGITDETYKRDKILFLLSHLSFVAHRMPAPFERVNIQTRAYGMKRALYQRVTSLYAPDGALLCENDARWVLVDTENWRILRKPRGVPADLFLDDTGEDGHDLAMPKPAAAWDAQSGQCARYMLCDRNGHINNTGYADLLCDMLPLDRLKAGPVRRMLLTYKHEIALGEEFRLCRAPAEGGGYCFAAFAGEKKRFEGYAMF